MPKSQEEEPPAPCLVALKATGLSLSTSPTGEKGARCAGPTPSTSGKTVFSGPVNSAPRPPRSPTISSFGRMQRSSPGKATPARPARWSCVVARCGAKIHPHRRRDLAAQPLAAQQPRQSSPAVRSAWPPLSSASGSSCTRLCRPPRYCRWMWTNAACRTIAIRACRPSAPRTTSPPSRRRRRGTRQWRRQQRPNLHRRRRR